MNKCCLETISINGYLCYLWIAKHELNAISLQNKIDNLYIYELFRY